MVKSSGRFWCVSADACVLNVYRWEVQFLIAECVKLCTLRKTEVPTKLIVDMPSGVAAAGGFRARVIG